MEHRDVKQALLDQIEHVDDAPGAAVTVVKWMDAFELVMDQRHLDKWVGIKKSCVVYEAFEVAHKRDDGFRLLRGRVDRFAGTIFQCCSR